MHAWLEPILFNIAGAALLALFATLVGSRTKRPALVHALWLLVLLKLVCPPALEIALLPRLGSWLPRPSQPVEPLASRDLQESGALEPPAQRSPRPDFADSRPGFDRLLPIALAAGAIFLLGLSAFRLLRFQRRLEHVCHAAPLLQSRAEELARVMGVSRAPRVLVVSETIAPSLWSRPRPGACEILFPAALLARLTAAERDLLLAHELAHVRRRDHWIRAFEMLVVAVYWWLPLAWWARRKLRAAEEESCDALVLARLPGRGRTYAEALLKTLEFIALRNQPVPALATGAGTANRLEERVTMILKHKPSRPLPASVRSLLLVSAALALLVSPAWVEKPATAAGPEMEVQGEMAKLQREEMRLQKQLRELEVRRMQIQRQIEEAMLKQQHAQMLTDLQQLEKEGKGAEAEELRRALTAMETDAAWRRDQIQFEQEHAAQRLRLEFELQELALQRDSLLTHGDEVRTRQLQERAMELEMQLRRLELRAMQNELDRNREQLEHEKQKLDTRIRRSPKAEESGAKP